MTSPTTPATHPNHFGASWGIAMPNHAGAATLGPRRRRARTLSPVPAASWWRDGCVRCGLGRPDIYTKA